MARSKGSVAFGAHLKKPGKKGQSWRSKISVVSVQTPNGVRKAYRVAGHDGWFAWANAKRVAKGYSTHRSHTSVRAKCKKGEISKAQAKAKLGYVPKACK